MIPYRGESAAGLLSFQGEGRDMKTGIICQACGVEAPTRYVELYQNVGVVFMRFHKGIKGQLCKKCISSHFWPMTLTTIGVGWLGMISIIIAPCFVINNVIRYLTTLGMPPVPDGARVPQVTPDEMRSFMPFSGDCFARLDRKEQLSAIAIDVAPKVNLTPGQVVACMRTIVQIEQMKQANQQSTGGFPVIPVTEPPEPAKPAEAPARPAIAAPLSAAEPAPAKPAEPQALGMEL